MNDIHQGIDLDFRPAGYFWPMDLATHLLATVKGAERRKHIQSLIDANRLDLLGDLVASSSLAPEVRQFTGRIHPWFMGDEYLPDQMKLFTAEGLLRAVVRGEYQGICNPTAVVHHAYIKWLLTQGEKSRYQDYYLSPEFPDGWLIKVQQLHSRRAPGRSCLSA